jgi:streptomycin 6-kinase
LEHDPVSGSLLLERLDGGRSLASVPDDLEALRVLAQLLARLVSVPAPTGMRQLADVAADLVERAPAALEKLADPEERRLVDAYAGAVREVLPEPGDRLLHWDLHFENVLAPHPATARTGEPWLAIDPKPLAGDPGFDLFPALWNRWADVAASNDVAAAVRRRFDLLTDVTALDRARALRWTCARLLQQAVWSISAGDTALAPEQTAIGRALLGR